jgi:hypothetical protein
MKGVNEMAKRKRRRKRRQRKQQKGSGLIGPILVGMTLAVLFILVMGK